MHFANDVDVLFSSISNYTCLNFARMLIMF